jgi:gliding motility-associated-like protein
VPTGTAPLTYLWSTGATSSVIGSLVKGPLSLTVTALNGCVSLSNVFIDIEPELEVNTITQKLLCHNDCNGGITLFAVNGNLPLTYSLTGGSSSYQTFSLCSGSYTATVTDTKGCFVTSTVNLINPAVITFTTNSINSSCSTLADGSASLAISGGRAPYSYTLAGANSFTSTASPFTNLLNGQYTLNVVDTLGCKSNTVLVTIVPTVTVDAVATPNFSVCIGTDVRVSAAGSQGALNYVWTDLGTNSNVSNIVSYSMTVFETQTLQVLVTSTNVNCFDTDTVIVSIFPKPFLDAGPATYTMSVYSSTMIGGNPTSLTGGPTHTWAPAEFLDSPESQNPVASNTLNTTFTVSIAYGDACLESDTVQVLIIPQVRISSGFSPNGDGKNDLFIIDYIDQFPLNTVEIYNRWGDLLFYSKGYETPWDGNFKGQQLPVGTYYYVIHLNHFAYTKPITGPVTIFR